MDECGQKISYKWAAYFLILVSFNSFALANKTIYVDDNGNADFNNIQAAIDNANDGDTILVAEGTYYENIIVKNGITLIGAGAEKTAIIGDGLHIVSFNNASGKISGFTITRSYNNPLSFWDGIGADLLNLNLVLEK